MFFFFFFSSRRRHTRLTCDWSSDVCSSDLDPRTGARAPVRGSEVVPPELHLGRVAFHVFRERLDVDFALPALDRERGNVLAELLEALADARGIRQMIEPRAPGVGDELAFEDRGIRVIDAQHLEAEFFRELERCRLRAVDEGRAG